MQRRRFSVISMPSGGFAELFSAGVLHRAARIANEIRDSFLGQCIHLYSFTSWNCV